MTETTMLDDSAVSEIEAMDHAEMCGDALYCNCGKVIRDQLCATVKHLRAENDEYERRWRNQTQRNHTLSQSNRDLQSQLEQLRAELRRFDGISLSESRLSVENERLRAENEELRQQSLGSRPTIRDGI